jgi:hypothetical protein
VHDGRAAEGDSPAFQHKETGGKSGKGMKQRREIQAISA